jgi:Leucine-rich repeat (LRR) protein
MTNALMEEFLAGFDDSRFPNDFLQRYELMECLSHNAMGETLLIKDHHTGKHYVAKCYARESIPSRASESTLLKKMHHDGLPAFIGEYQNEKTTCVVREFVQGNSLDKLAKEIKFTRQQSIDIVLQICDILIYLHGQNPPIIHRDIKPQNIIVNEQGKATLIDFNISRTYDESAQEDTLCFGTKKYAAPEQYGFSQTDCRSDIYSLGILLCWLLTGNIDVQQVKKEISDHRLVSIINKCTAFDPKDRFKNAVQVRDALTNQLKPRQKLSIFFASLTLLAAIFYFSKFPAMQGQQPSEINFQEPLIEAAVRLELGMDEGEAISMEDLLSVNELYVFGDKAAADDKTFLGYVDSFANNGGSFQRGSIFLLDDLKYLKNLQRFSLAYQNITDLTPLSELEMLEFVDLRHNPLADITPLSHVSRLQSLIVFGTNVADLSSLGSCPKLSIVDAGDTLITSMTAFDGLDSLEVLVLRKAPLQSLEQIRTHPNLQKLYISETLLNDLTPLLDLPGLQLVEVDESMRLATEVIEERAQFQIVFQ